MIISHKETSIVFKIYICILMLLTTIMGGDLYVKYFANDVLNFILFLFSGI
ncbi:hypothetical protein Ab1vBOLIVR5_gp148 [Agrobacterium phage OLIVR5]|uniref:Uncharacterized protein n=1 Tax=Agrobacterium phage OLIVR5 TaxID=2723773 RepID=A0A858MSV3_9CAUD|nr:hypothetical protein KNU99_gp253 [Agrobacterium phage OLIVR5]QIW87796.1 hypothetical protein Ab1vBOLIVR5_gp148 [Agrobacterium phage OLIVR5]QIW88061.1 hypothetical protein Ab1vBOLIVR6_gp154 [Agrobacterium phage OLIVR6]